MSRRLVVVLVILAAAVGAGIALAVDALDDPGRADPYGLPVICVDERDRCWQGGNEVQPVVARGCGEENDGWLPFGDEPPFRSVFFCARGDVPEGDR